MIQEKRQLRQWLFAASLLLTSGATSFAETPLSTELVASGLSSPLFLTYAPGDPTRLFVVEKAGRIRIIKNGVVLATPFLDIDARVDSTTLEWGLLSMTFHPDYQSNGFFYVNFNETTTGNTVIARYKVTANPDVASAASEQIILYLVQPSPNHRGGWLQFGPDGYLYDSQGDGGGQNDPSNRAQNIDLLQGKILRLDVNGPDGVPGTADDDGFSADANKNYRIPPDNPFVGVGGADEIWAYGLRNPWRCSFDRETWDLWIGDVGQFQREEIDVIPFGSTPPLNFGWRCMEAELCTGMTGCTCNAPTLTPKVYSYASTVGKSITGGYVYRGCAIPDLRGTYFFADYQIHHIWTFRYVNGVVTNLTERSAELDPPGGATVGSVAAFGEGIVGELYILDLGGEIFRIIPAGGAGAAAGVTLTLNETLPALIPACASFSFDLRVDTCGVDVQEQTASLHYRFDDGAFQTVGLAALGNSQFRATLPACPCGGAPEFYLSILSVGGDVTTDPVDAPISVHRVAVGEGVANVLHEERFESGLPGGWSATGLWNVTSACSVAPVCDGAAWAYYGQNGACNYDVGANSGSLTTPLWVLPQSPQVMLSYCSTFERENFATSDWPSVRVNGVTVDQPAAGGRGSSPWEQRSVNLTQFAGQPVAIEFHFQTGDAFGNDFHGWQVDDLVVSVVEAQCDAPAFVIKGDMNQIDGPNGADMAGFVAAVMAESTHPEDVCPGDFTDDGRVTQDDIPAFVSLLITP